MSTNPSLNALQPDGQPNTEAEAKIRVLVVDDVADNREVLTRRLERRNFEVVEAVGGYDALKKIEEQSFDCVLLDIMMPDLNGRDVLIKLREQYNELELPIIMVSAKSQSEDVVDCLDHGANDYVTKPVDFLVALSRVNAQVQRKRAADKERFDKEALARQTVELSSTVEESKAQLRRTSAELAFETKRRERTEEELNFLAYHDSLTTLLNRTAFDDALSHAFESMESSDLEPALLFIDLDGFKAINDLHGHKVGDVLLQQVAERLREILGPQTPIARLGGDEFAAIVMAEQQPEVAVQLGEEIVTAMTKPFLIDDRNCEVGVSCGVARANACGDDLNAMIKSADLAMYHAKASGRGGVVLFESQMLVEREQRRSLEIDLKAAVRNGDFQLFYQPLIDAQTRKITCFEALLRWDHPSRGMISPEIFIPLAEEMGLIMPLGDWVLRQACTQAATWPEHMRIAVNLSPLQFRNPSLMTTIMNALATSGLAPNRLELEITESALLSTEERNTEILNSLRQLGVRISMDDFGTGYSSLGYLKHFRFDKIKIDKCFIQSIQEDDCNAAIVQAIVELSAGIGMSTTAEGVETAEELDFVTKQGCTEIQGYFFSRPLTSKDAQTFIDAQT
ncbi:putative bifunctional diguanylate cyclase/phosphodiesterase [Pseudahrensia aquimaris]|uniref:Bifunctional diguanylate cyclase/phosphodiesterase n=1 Tax=Pseudahrensia aquimaris TaxID=744461 RepID=A0ABW3FGT7_9HYPH